MFNCWKATKRFQLRSTSRASRWQCFRRLSPLILCGQCGKDKVLRRWGRLDFWRTAGRALDPHTFSMVRYVATIQDETLEVVCIDTNDAVAFYWTLATRECRCERLVWRCKWVLLQTCRTASVAATSWTCNNKKNNAFQPRDVIVSWNVVARLHCQKSCNNWLMKLDVLKYLCCVTCTKEAMNPTSEEKIQYIIL
jgi:hypothetical protein